MSRCLQWQQSTVWTYELNGNCTSRFCVLYKILEQVFCLIDRGIHLYHAIVQSQTHWWTKCPFQVLLGSHTIYMAINVIICSLMVNNVLVTFLEENKIYFVHKKQQRDRCVAICCLTSLWWYTKLYCIWWHWVLFKVRCQLTEWVTCKAGMKIGRQQACESCHLSLTWINCISKQEHVPPPASVRQSSVFLLDEWVNIPVTLDPLYLKKNLSEEIK